jgi:histidyl-tRNA synthetase
LSAARAILDGVGLTERTSLLVNCLGSADDRARFCTALAAWLTPRRRQLSPLAAAQLDAGGHALLRILDSSDDDDVSVLSDPTCPSLADFVSSHDRRQFEETLDVLRSLGIEAEVRPTLVRGLDYYTGLAFEFVSRRNPSLTVLGGGRYDPLVQQYDARFGGTGFAAGVERMALTLTEDTDPGAVEEAGSTRGHQRTIALVYEPTVTLVTALSTANKLRADGFTVYMRHSGSLKKQIGAAVDHGARLLLRLDSPTTCVLKDLRDPDDRTGSPYPLENVSDALMRKLFSGIEWMDTE